MAGYGIEYHWKFAKKDGDGNWQRYAFETQEDAVRELDRQKKFAEEMADRFVTSLRPTVYEFTTYEGAKEWADGLSWANAEAEQDWLDGRNWCYAHRNDQEWLEQMAMFAGEMFAGDDEAE